MIRVLTETRTVYRSEVGRRGRFTKKAAYMDAAWQAWRAKYPCGCEVTEDADFVCPWHRVGDWNDDSSGEMAEYRRKVIARLARWLMWRDKRMAEVSK